MNLGQTGLLPKLKDPQTPNLRYWEIQGENKMLDKIAQIPFDPVKFVEVDEEEIRKVISECIHKEINGGYKEGGIYPETVAHALASAKERWLKAKEKI